jgi:hypothetical protein
MQAYPKAEAFTSEMRNVGRTTVGRGNSTRALEDESGELHAAVAAAGAGSMHTCI